MSLSRRILALSFLCVFAGNFGQSFFVSWFSAPIKEGLELSASAYGGIYSGATLISAFCMLLVGGLIDRFALRIFLNVSLFGLLVAAALLATTTNVLQLFLGFLALRLFGQALLTHTGITTVVKATEPAELAKRRGRYVSMVGLAIPLGEVVLPIIAVGLLATAIWQYSFIVLSGFILLVLFPTANLLLPLRYSHPVQAKNLAASSRRLDKTAQQTREIAKGRRYAIQDKNFWKALPTVLIAAFVITGVLIHQDYFLQQEGWTAEMIASVFVLFGIVHGISTLSGGQLIDRYTALKLFPCIPLPLILALLALILFNGTLSLVLMMTGFAICVGLGSPIVVALWAEVYGTDYIGGIRSMVTSFAVWSTAASPFLYGAYIDHFNRPIALSLPDGDNSYIILICLNILLCMLAFFLAKRAYQHQST